MKKILFPILILAAALSLSAQDFSIARFKGDRKAAVSFTFDDGYLDQYTLAVPELERRGWRGTFWIVPTRIDHWGVKPLMSWEQIKELSDKGHEMSNHGLTHAHITQIPSEEVPHEIHDADTILAAHTGKFPITYCFAYGDCNPDIIKMAAENRVGIRFNQKTLGGSNTCTSLTGDLKKAIDDGEWLITMTHAMLDGYDQFEKIEDFTEFLDIVKKYETDLWIDTFENIASYTELQKATSLSVRKKSETTFVITPSCSLDQEIFKLTLTFRVDRKPSDSVKIKQGGKMLETRKVKNRWMAEINPFNGPITVKYIQSL
ncbi:MAG: polysaccharide deacetylase family protein [Alistipes sp.]|nr:polysaccharide deacetylase family protein [Candidatus Minthomonas equi]